MKKKFSATTLSTAVASAAVWPRRIAIASTTSSGTTLSPVIGAKVSRIAIAILDTFAPITGLSVVPLLVVLAIAIRRGQTAALATAVLSVVALNFFFIEPRYRLTISEP